jgi:hypothetical protein
MPERRWIPKITINISQKLYRKKGEKTNVVYLSKNGCFDGGNIIDNEVIWLQRSK